MPRIAAALVVFATSAFCIGFNIVRYPVVWERIAAGGHLPQSGEPAESAGAEPVASNSAYADPYAYSDWAEDSSTDGSIVASISGAADLDESEDPWDYTQTDTQAYTGGSHTYDYDEEDAWGSYSGDEATCTDGQCPIGGGNKGKRENRDWTPNGEDDSFAGGVEEPLEAWPSSRYGSNSVEAVEDPYESSDSDRWDADGDLVPVRRPWGSGRARETAGSGDWQVAGEDTARDGAVRRLPPLEHVSTPDVNRYGPPPPADSIPLYPTTGIQ